jgi:hypothetical protein
VEKVTAFYENALQSGGWQVEKTAKSGDQGACKVGDRLSV